MFVTDPPPMPLVGAAVTTGAVNVLLVPLGRIITQLAEGTVINVEETVNGWSRITISAYVATGKLRKA